VHTTISNNKRKTRREIMHPDLVILETLLKSHDWTYNYTDDHTVWCRGRDEADEIRRQIDICCGQGLDEIANKFRDKYNPFNQQ
jgi:hypothetical protein